MWPRHRLLQMANLRIMVKPTTLNEDWASAIQGSAGVRRGRRARIVQPGTWETLKDQGLEEVVSEVKAERQI
ncbi:MAG: hypothetical protein S4CHLAM123_08680 [Chlamydiales bacterium]|nr:hypothetical protein [Chlamydiales bacterium]